MLYLTRDAACDVHLRVNSYTGLTDLTVVVAPASVNSSATCANLAVKLLGKLEEHIEVLLRAYAVATSHNDRSTLEVVLCSLNVAVEHLHNEVCLGHVLGYVRVNHLALCLALIESLLHHAAAHGSHLRTVLRVDDSSHDVATESRTNLIEQIVVVNTTLLVVVVANLKLCTVGCKTAGERRRNARTEVATYNCSTHKRYLRLLLLEEVHKDVGMRSRCVREEALSVEDEELVNAVRQNLIFHLALNTSTRNHSVQLYAELVGELAALGEKFLRHFLNLSAFYLAIYKYVVHYPIIFSSNNSFTKPSMSASQPVRVLLSLAWNTMFLTAFTLVGEPLKPHCCGSPSTSATVHWLSVR